ncbi:MAG: accessory factor UbiK family protein [Alphaproteobacteria bacterium]|nr:accessory factor UbiK family protein [Alphaproteobacteria bacterium]
MQGKDKILDDIARVAGGAVGVFSGLNHSIREDIRGRIDETALRLDLVPRAEFERLELMLSEALSRLEKLEARLESTVPDTKAKTKTKVSTTSKAKKTKA